MHLAVVTYMYYYYTNLDVIMGHLGGLFQDFSEICASTANPWPSQLVKNKLSAAKFGYLKRNIL